MYLFIIYVIIYFEEEKMIFRKKDSEVLKWLFNYGNFCLLKIYILN